MLTATQSVDISLKPRVLIADDSRIVRATLIKHIQGIFEFREALDGEQAWETLLLDPNIKVLITDLTMPKLDGYGLLERVRTSKIGRIRNMPVVVVSGSDEQQERERVKKAGATELITKGIGTAQLLSQLDVLSKLTNTQREYERSLEAFVQNGETNGGLQPTTIEELRIRAEAMLASSVRQRRNLVVFSIGIGVEQLDAGSELARPDDGVINAIGKLFSATVRQSDIVALTGASEFTIVTSSVALESAHNFAERLCQAIAGANLSRAGQPMQLTASCGLVSKCSEQLQCTQEMPDFSLLVHIARRRCALGMQRGISGVIGMDEEKLFS